MNFKAMWMASFSWCAANDLQLVTFETQDEYDNFLALVKAKRSSHLLQLKSSGGGEVLLYLGGYCKTPGQLTGWIWYGPGKPTSVNWGWQKNQPDNWQNAEWCMNYKYDATVGLWAMNDLPCNMYNLPPVCQEVNHNTFFKGFNSN